MSLQLLVERIHSLNKWFNHYETPVAVTIAILSHYLFNCYIIWNKFYVYKA
jgi:hypothetical protein